MYVAFGKPKVVELEEGQAQAITQVLGMPRYNPDFTE
jgi:hypothetical protein